MDRTLRVAVVVTLALLPCFAHEDQPLTIKPDGTLVGLPKTFQPCSINIQFNSAKSDEPPIASFTITLSGHMIRIPKGLLSLIRSQSIEALSASASWYHEEALSPHYLRLEFLDPGFIKGEWNSGIVIEFNLHSGKVFAISRMVHNKAERSLNQFAIRPSQYCAESELPQFYEPWRIKTPKKTL